MLNTAHAIGSALLIDRLFGEPRRLHPLVGFGNYSAWLENRLNTGVSSMRGLLAWMLAVLPFVMIVDVLWLQPALRFAIDILALYFALGMQSLSEHARHIARALQAGDLPQARKYVSEIVSRDTAAMYPEDVASASVESVLENGNDAVFGALFWFALLGAPGAILFRLANTLDAMWGYRTERYLQFGWAAARIDDALNYMPARLTAFTYALLGKTAAALRCWRVQAPAWESPNAGPVMASGAGSLQVRLGGAAQYHGVIEPRPQLGTGNLPQAADIERAIRLVQRGAWLWLAVLLLIEVAQYA